MQHIVRDGRLSVGCCGSDLDASIIGVGSNVVVDDREVFRNFVGAFLEDASAVTIPDDIGTDVDVFSRQ